MKTSFGSSGQDAAKKGAGRTFFSGFSSFRYRCTVQGAYHAAGLRQDRCVYADCCLRQLLLAVRITGKRFIKSACFKGFTFLRRTDYLCAHFNVVHVG